MDSNHIWPYPQPQAATTQTAFATTAVAPGAPAIAMAEAPVLPDSYLHYAQQHPAAQPHHFPHSTAYSTYHYYHNPNPNPTLDSNPYANPAPEAPLQSDAHPVHLRLPDNADVSGHYGGHAMLHSSSYSYDGVPPSSVSVVFHGHTQGLGMEQVVHSYENFPLGGGCAIRRVEDALHYFVLWKVTSEPCRRVSKRNTSPCASARNREDAQCHACAAGGWRWDELAAENTRVRSRLEGEATPSGYISHAFERLVFTVYRMPLDALIMDNHVDKLELDGGELLKTSNRKQAVGGEEGVHEGHDACEGDDMDEGNVDGRWPAAESRVVRDTVVGCHQHRQLGKSDMAWRYSCALMALSGGSGNSWQCSGWRGMVAHGVRRLSPRLGVGDWAALAIGAAPPLFKPISLSTSAASFTLLAADTRLSLEAEHPSSFFDRDLDLYRRLRQKKSLLRDFWCLVCVYGVSLLIVNSWCSSSPSTSSVVPTPTLRACPDLHLRCRAYSTEGHRGSRRCVDLHDSVIKLINPEWNTATPSSARCQLCIASAPPLPSRKGSTKAVMGHHWGVATSPKSRAALFHVGVPRAAAAAATGSASSLVRATSVLPYPCCWKQAAGGEEGVHEGNGGHEGDIMAEDEGNAGSLLAVGKIEERGVVDSEGRGLDKGVMYYESLETDWKSHHHRVKPCIIVKHCLTEALCRHCIHYEPYGKPCMKRPVIVVQITPPHGNERVMHSISKLTKKATKVQKRSTKVVQSVYCEVCKIKCDTQQILMSHKQGKKHKKNMQKLQESITAKITNAPSIIAQDKVPVVDPDKEKPTAERKRKNNTPATAQDLEEKKRRVLECGADAAQLKICAICNVVVNSQKVYDFHISGQKHADMVKKREEKGSIHGMS
ncbi:hypothetical protein ZIOFF_074754 [Zingiber officinale]|uniref:U1-type domain-containing protein n=1 Tax=Zingiber officinale TaxID=94328 RepID=A0A8J5ENA1_ZINOF|nr:hypothetical protein ZIOFF_074754 [Zingiber officinale]